MTFSHLQGVAVVVTFTYIHTKQINYESIFVQQVNQVTCNVRVLYVTCIEYTLNTKIQL